MAANWNKNHMKISSVKFNGKSTTAELTSITKKYHERKKLFDWAKKIPEQLQKRDFFVEKN